MFKKITASILLLAFVSQTFAGPFIMLDYFMNTAAYAKNCINKARPKMHCNGKCQAMKKIQEEERKEQQNAEEKAASKVQVLSSRSFFSLLIIPARSSSKLLFHKFSESPIDRNFAVFQPPQA
jgi:hypothetical protein